MTLKFYFFSLLILVSNYSFTQSWYNVSSGIPNGQVFKMIDYNGQLIVGGNFSNAGGVSVNKIASWNGSVWSNLGTGLNSSAQSFAVYNNELYVGGSFSLAGGISVNGIAKWNGVSWSSIPSIAGTAYTNVVAMEVHNNELYASVMGTTGGASTNTIYRFNGTNWSVFAAIGFGTLSAKVWAIKSIGPNGNLYFAGEFSTINGSSFNNIAKWDGSTWSSVGTGIPLSTATNNRIITSLEVYNNELYAAGDFDLASGIAVTNVAKWNGNNWSSVGIGLPATNMITDLQIFESQLYAGGSTVSRWNGSSWSNVGNLNANIGAIGVSNSKLFVGGSYWDIIVNNNTLFNIAQLSNTSISITVSANPICSGNNVTFTTNVSNIGSSPIYQWKVNGNNVGTNSPTYSTSNLSNNQVVQCVLTSSSVSISSNSISMTVNPTPSTPSISNNGNLLTSSASTGNQWYKDGTIIFGANSQNYLVTQNGSYTVKVTNGNCISQGSLPFYVGNLSINEQNIDENFMIFPNPANTHFSICLGNFSLTPNHTIIIENSLGQVLLKTNVSQPNEPIDISTISAKGTYFVIISDRDGMKLFREQLIIN